MQRHGGTRSLALLAVMVLSAGVGFAQFRGSIEGTVTDSTDAVVTEAKAVLTSIGTGVTSTTSTNGTGFYKFSRLTPGSYRMTVAVGDFVPEALTCWRFSVWNLPNETGEFAGNSSTVEAHFRNPVNEQLRRFV